MHTLLIHDDCFEKVKHDVFSFVLSDGYLFIKSVKRIEDGNTVAITYLPKLLKKSQLQGSMPV